MPKKESVFRSFFPLTLTFFIFLNCFSPFFSLRSCPFLFIFLFFTKKSTAQLHTAHNTHNTAQHTTAHHSTAQHNTAQLHTHALFSVFCDFQRRRRQQRTLAQHCVLHRTSYHAWFAVELRVLSSEFFVFRLCLCQGRSSAFGVQSQLRALDTRANYAVLGPDSCWIARVYMLGDRAKSIDVQTTRFPS